MLSLLIILGSIIISVVGAIIIAFILSKEK